MRTNRAISKLVLMRINAVTHSVNTDQRRVPGGLAGSMAKGYVLGLTANRSVLIPGAYLLFALDASGTPSVGKLVTVH